MHSNNKPYLPALRFEFLTRFYDPLVRFATREYAFKRALLAQANLQNNQTILDLACGTGTLSVWVKKQFPEANIYAFDADAEILRMARTKAKKFHAEINFEQGFSDNLPFPDKQFDGVFSTLFFHHLTLEKKIKTLREVRRVLKTGGEFHLADYALPRNKTQFVLSKSVSLIDGFASTHDNLRGRLKVLMEETGFSQVAGTGYFKTILGTIRLFKAIK
ncbi:MAG: class I SAM-dependent methyltransferase [Pyrinomonadaceae bacterium]